MIRKVFLGAVLWTMFISLLHVQLNIGWSELGSKLRVALGTEREQMIVGFLPVT